MGCFSGSTSTSKTETKTLGQKKGIKKALDVYVPELGKGPEIYPEARVAPFTPLQQEAVTGAGKFADYFSEPQAVETPLFEETGQAAKDLLQGNIGATDFRGATSRDIMGATTADVRGATDYTGATEADIAGAKTMTPEDIEAYFGRAIHDPTMKTFREDVIPGIAESFAGPGFFGAARSQEQSQAYQDVGSQLSAGRAGLEWDVLGRNQEIAEALAARRVAAAEAKAGRKLTAEENEAVRHSAAAEAKANRRFAAAEAEAGRRFTAGESRAERSLATLAPAMAYGQMPAQEIQNNLNIAAQKIGGLNQIFGFGQAEQTQAQMELQDEIMRFAEENQITDPENLEILLTLLGMNFSRSKTTQAGAGLGYAGVSSFLGGFGGGLGLGMATPTS